MPMTSPVSLSTGGRPPLPPTSKKTSPTTSPTISPTTSPTTSPTISPTISPTTKLTQNSSQVSKPPYQFIIDFFQELGKKIMDLFTPTSKEAIKKALLKSKLKEEIYLTRIEQITDYLEKNTGLSELEKEVYNEDIQKTTKKLEKYKANTDELTTKWKKLTHNTAQATEAKVVHTANSGTEGLNDATPEILKEADSLINKVKTAVSELVDGLVVLVKKLRP